MSSTRKPSSSASTNCVNAQRAKSLNYWRRRPMAAKPIRILTRLLLRLIAWLSPVSNRWSAATSATNFYADFYIKDLSATASFLFFSLLTFLKMNSFILFLFLIGFFVFLAACGLIAHRTCSATGLPACLQGLPERANRLHNRTGWFSNKSEHKLI